MALAPPAKVVLGSAAFAIFWVLAVFPSVSLLPIGRTAGSLLGAVLMVVLRVISPTEAYAAIDLPILGLLFGTMVVSAFLERADMFKHLGRLLSWRSRGGRDLLCRVCAVSAVASALFTNDTCCVVLTEFVLKVARQHDLPARPFLLALASSANIGSAATPIGNPQNLVIAVRSGLGFGEFLLGVLPAMVVGVLANTAILLCYFWKALAVDKDEEAALSDLLSEDHRFSPATMSHPASLSSFDADAIVQSSPNVESVASPGVESVESVGASAGGGKKGRMKRMIWKACVYVVTLGMLVSLLMGLDMSWTAITAALSLIVLDFKDARPCLEKVSYSLLIFFCGMFITVDGFNKTGIPSALWDFMEPHARVDSVAGVAMLALVVLFLSNVASNVPTVLLLGARVAASAAQISPAQEKRAWLILAWTSTVAGNLSLLGSAANLIVCEQARRAQPFPHTLSFFTHLRFGFPSTLVITAIGLPLIKRF